MAFDYKKEYKEFYMPKSKPSKSLIMFFLFFLPTRKCFSKILFMITYVFSSYLVFFISSLLL